VTKTTPLGLSILSFPCAGLSVDLADTNSEAIQKALLSPSSLLQPVAPSLTHSLWLEGFLWPTTYKLPLLKVALWPTNCVLSSHPSVPIPCRVASGVMALLRHSDSDQPTKSWTNSFLRHRYNNNRIPGMFRALHTDFPSKIAMKKTKRLIAR